MRILSKHIKFEFDSKVYYVAWTDIGIGVMDEEFAPVYGNYPLLCKAEKVFWRAQADGLI